MTMQRTRSQAGAALVLAVIFGALLIGLGLVALDTLPSTSRSMGDREGLARARYWGHAAATLARQNLADGGSGSLDGSFTTGARAERPGVALVLSGLLGVSSADLATSLEGAPDGTFTTRARSLITGEVIIEALSIARGVIAGVVQVVRIERVRGELPRAGAFGAAGLVAEANIQTDAWDSRLLPYLLTLGLLRDGGHIGSNASIRLTSGRVRGDANPGPEGSLLPGGASITGSTAPAAEPFPLRPVVFRSPVLHDNANLGGAVDSNGRLEVSSGTVNVPSGTYVLERLRSNGDGVIQITGDVTIYVRDQLRIEDGAVLAINPGARLTVYAADDVRIGGQGIRNRTGLFREGIPERAQILVGRDLSLPEQNNPPPVRISTTLPLFGVVYAPGRVVEATAPATIYGAIVGDVVRATSDITIHYDRALREVSMGEDDVEARILAAWRPVTRR